MRRGRGQNAGEWIDVHKYMYMYGNTYQSLLQNRLEDVSKLGRYEVLMAPHMH